jgi:hypothetical protein
MPIHFIFTFQRNFKPFISTILASFWNSKGHLGELETIEGDVPIWKPLAWKTNYAQHGLFYVPYNGSQ